MRIIIVGAGKVGKNLIDLLLEEKHDLVVIDKNPTVIEDIVDNFDVKGVVGNGASFEVLNEAELNKTDVVIASTSSDELNILSCLVSKKNGVNHTIARVRNPEYSNQIGFIHNELGLNLIVNPELEAASEIAQLLMFPSALKIDRFAKGQVDLVEIKLTENSELIGKSLIDLRKQLQVKILVCAVERDGKAIIPDGNFIFRGNDKIHVTAPNKEIIKFFKKLKILKNRARLVMIIGGGKIAYYLAKQLQTYNIKLKVIEHNKDRCLELSESLANTTIIHGAGSDQNLLEEEGIENIDALVTLTGFDEENIIISLYANTKNVPKVITKINRDPLMNILESIGIDTIISPKSIIANSVIRYVRSIEKALDSEVKTLYKLVNNQVEASEFYIPKQTKFTNIPFKDLRIKKNVLIATIIRHKTIIIPSGNDYIIANDSVIVVSTEKIYNLEDIVES